MSLKVNLRHLEPREICLKGELPVGELDFDLRDEMLQVREPMHYDVRVEKVSHGLLAQGRLVLSLDCRCVRCLKSFKKTIELANWTLHLPLEGEDKATVDNDCVDLTPYVREDMLLEFPQHPLCSPDCAGLKKNGRSQAQTGRSAWDELNKLKL